MTRFPTTRSGWLCSALLLGVCAGMARADFAAGLKAYQDKDYAGAFREWKPAAEAGNPAAQFNVGLMYLDGTGTVQSYQDAVLWFRRSADQGYAKAQKNLGALYAVGTGVRRDYPTAYFWFNLCASTGDSTCTEQRNLIAPKLKGKALAEAQRRAADWKAVPEVPKQP